MIKLIKVEPEVHNEKIEIWGGVECTVVRINNKTHDQLEISGHENRPDDLNLFAGLGIRTIRYPLLWEKYISGKEFFFSRHDDRLKRITDLGITPVAGLLHHGSGPFYTDLMDESFPEQLAEYAYMISEKYPWIRYYTPVNEPLTTARFSGLYGIWYPHLRDDRSFLRIFVNEMKAIVLSMKAVAINNPAAGLIQTEDLCKVHSTPLLDYQADFENKRRWLTYDFLTGRFTPEHPLWMYFISNGIQLKELEFFIQNKMEPAICGFNYYLSSERFLDDDLSKYPEIFHGGNGTHKYADVEAARVPEVQVNLYELLQEAWQRYHLPLALTEIHLACTREEQLRWFNEAYSIVTELKKENVDFRAVTTWSFLGSYDWNSLLRTTHGEYEAGVYDIRSGAPRPTALASMIKDINMGNTIENCLLKTPGWWRRDIRNTFGKKQSQFDTVENGDVPPVMILGSSGSLGKAFSKICHTRGIVHRLINRQQLDITSQRSIENIIESEKPWALINAIGFTGIDEAEKDPMTCFRVNTFGPAMLASVCHANNIKMLTFSADQVFDGRKRIPYLESDKPSPINIYGQSKRKAEEVILMVNPDALIIRSSAFYNPWVGNDILVNMLNNETRSDLIHYFPNDIIISPTYIADLVNTALDLMIDGESGIWHLSNQEEISQFQFIKMALEMAGKGDRNIAGIPAWRLNYAAERPHYSVLSNSKGISLPPLSIALEKYLDEVAITK